MNKGRGIWDLNKCRFTDNATGKVYNMESFISSTGYYWKQDIYAQGMGAGKIKLIYFGKMLLIGDPTNIYNGAPNDPTTYFFEINFCRYFTILQNFKLTLF